jgi:hypothetical protein
MTGYEPGTPAPARAASSRPFSIEPVPYTNYPGRYYDGVYRVACTSCEWRGPSRFAGVPRAGLMLAFDQNTHERCPAAEAGLEAEADV